MNTSAGTRSQFPQISPSGVIKARHRSHGWTRLRRVACALLLLLGAGCVRPGPALKVQQTYSLAPHSYGVGIVREGWHTGIIIPAHQLSGPLASLRPMVPQAPFIGIGWGNRQYYRERHPSLLTGLRALFPSRSVVHVTAWSRQHLVALSRTKHLYWISISAHHWHRFQSFLARSFTRGPQSTFVSMGPKTAHGNFFASPQTYDAWHTCNTWTAKALRTIGFREHGPVFFAGQVTDDLHQFKVFPSRRAFKTSPPTPALPLTHHHLRQP